MFVLSEDPEMTADKESSSQVDVSPNFRIVGTVQSSGTESGSSEMAAPITSRMTEIQVSSYTAQELEAVVHASVCLEIRGEGLSYDAKQTTDFLLSLYAEVSAQLFDRLPMTQLVFWTRFLRVPLSSVTSFPMHMQILLGVRFLFLDLLTSSSGKLSPEKRGDFIDRLLSLCPPEARDALGGAFAEPSPEELLEPVKETEGQLTFSFLKIRLPGSACLDRNSEVCMISSLVVNLARCLCG
eukprot:RCo003543